MNSRSDFSIVSLMLTLYRNTPKNLQEICQSRSSGENEFFILVHAFDNAKWPFKESWFYSHYTDGVNEAAHIDELDEPEKCLFEITFLHWPVIGFSVKFCLIKRWICSDRVYLKSVESWKKLHRDGCLKPPIVLIQTASQDGENWELGNLDSVLVFSNFLHEHWESTLLLWVSVFTSVKQGE